VVRERCSEVSERLPRLALSLQSRDDSLGDSGSNARESKRQRSDVALRRYPGHDGEEWVESTIRALLTLNGNNSDRQALRDGGIKALGVGGLWVKRGTLRPPMRASARPGRRGESAACACCGAGRRRSVCESEAWMKHPGARRGLWYVECRADCLEAAPVGGASLP
jgi:hypothetical protein